jgi:hypothetical protein
MRRTSFNLLFLSGLTGLLAASVACADGRGNDDESTTSITSFTAQPETGDNGDGDGDPDDTMGCPPGGCLDLEDTDSEGGGGCSSGDGSCNQVDLLFVIDNSGTMGEEQVNLSANFPLLIDKLQMLTGEDGELLNPDVHIMVTTTDVGHPQCTQFQIDGYAPAVGSPQATACSERLEYFTGLGSNPPSFPEACDCPVPIEPTNAPFIEFSGPMGSITNVPANDVKGALSCIGPQGIVGCGYEAPLESMLQAIYDGAAWNQGAKPFLRDGAILAIAIITDEADCSVRSPDGYAYFTDANMNTYWEVNPDTGTKTQSTSAVCWNAGVDCGSPDVNGVYPDCASADTGVLHPLTRYLNYLQNNVIDDQNKEVIMLGILGVPVVTAHNPNPPFQPTAGGVMDLEYRQWIDGPYPNGDILPGDDGDAATKEFEFGVGPGCTGEDGLGGFTGQAIPPVRVKEVCEALNDGEKIRCCIESICDTDFSDAIGCLTGIIQTVVVPPK